MYRRNSRRCRRLSLFSADICLGLVGGIDILLSEESFNGDVGAEMVESIEPLAEENNFHGEDDEFASGHRDSNKS